MDISELIRKEALRRGLSHKTIRTYRQCVRKFFNWCRKEPHEIKKADIKSYLDLMIEKGACGNTINVNLNALKFFYGSVLHKRLMINIRYSKTPKSLPIVLTKEEVAMLVRQFKMFEPLEFARMSDIDKIIDKKLHLHKESKKENEHHFWAGKV